jgi:hypothetical protein
MYEPLLDPPIFSGTQPMELVNGGVHRVRSKSPLNRALSVAGNLLSYFPSSMQRAIAEQYYDWKARGATGNGPLRRYYIEKCAEHEVNDNVDLSRLDLRQLNRILLDTYGVKCAIA